MIIRKRLIDKTTQLQKLTTAVAHRYRLATLYLLAHEPRETRELSYMLSLKEPLLIHHLQILCNAGWIKRVRTGRHVTYELNDDCAVELKKFLGDTPFFRTLSR